MTSHKTRSLDARLMAEVGIHRSARTTFLISLIAQAITGILIIGQAILLSSIIDRVFRGQQHLADVSPLLLDAAGVVIARAILTYISAQAASSTAVTIKHSLLTRAIEHLHALGPAFTHTERSGDLALTLTDGIEKLDGYYHEYLPSIFNALYLPLLILLFVLPVDALTFVILLITAPLIPLFMALIGMAAGSLARQQFSQMRLLGAHFLDVMQGLVTLKLFNRSAHQTETIRRITSEFRQATMRVLRVAFLSAFMLELLATLSVAIVAVEIGVRLIDGRIGFQPALFLLMIAPEFYLPLRTLGARFHNATEGKAAAERLYQVLDAPILMRLTDTIPIPTRMYIRFDQVHLDYEAGKRPALNGVTFELQPGAITALIGASGGGKTTIAQLLLRFIEPDGGSITVDDVDLASLIPEEWRRQIGWVSQQPYLFNGTIAENIRFSQPDAPMQTIIQAAQRANAHGFIMQFPQGYDTPCGERGLRLSGGQAQRIALARAFLRDAPLLILDEPTSQLDTDTEAEIIQTLDALMSGRTVLLIAHRLSTVRHADHIVVIEQGQVIEQGTHESLMASGGLYCRLIQQHEEETLVS
ncbi:MAG: thiol reductant ABC exporter subunit CydD [Anaerolineae bacterium]